MLNHILPGDTQSILLLCGHLGSNHSGSPEPLSLGEYNTLASWLRENNLTPGSLLSPDYRSLLLKNTIGKLQPERLIALLERGLMLSLAVEKWTNLGLWILGRGDEQYPKRLKLKLGKNSPPLLYGVGNRELLSKGGLAVVGSREVDQEGLNYTQMVGKTCAIEKMQIVSGGARGVDEASMLAALEVGGTVIGVIADSLVKASVKSKYRTGIREGRLTLISPYNPEAGFSVGNAMGRNKYIYALSDYALVVSSSVGKGGTWAGATEALEKIKGVPVFVRMEGSNLQGNQELLNKGAKKFPENPWSKSLKEILAEASNSQSSLEAPKDICVETPNLTQPPEDNTFQLLQNTPISIPKDAYEAVLPLILNNLKLPKDAKSLAESLDVQLKQMQEWLKKAVAEKKVIKHNKPVTYEVNPHPDLLSLLEEKS